MYAVQAMPTVSKIWHHPKASRGRTVREVQAPTVEPIASPMRKTARMIENT